MSKIKKKELDALRYYGEVLALWAHDHKFAKYIAEEGLNYIEFEFSKKAQKMALRLFDQYYPPKEKS